MNTEKERASVLKCASDGSFGGSRKTPVYFHFFLHLRYGFFLWGEPPSF
jgi:hypothetical protein